ncbi:hypothetical protein LSUE1_G005922, partial [Lachnellula suecica]
GNAQFTGPSSISFDFGKNIAGLVSVTVGDSSSPDASLSLTYTESSTYISSQSCDGTRGPQFDQPISLPVGKGPNIYSVEREHERGGFRYLTVTNNGNTNIDVTRVAVYFTAAPQQDLRQYWGYFHCNDELLNKIWYAGAYTNQLCTIDPNHGVATIQKFKSAKRDDTLTWFNNVTIANGGTVLVDGAKRDREIWPGDMVVQIPSVFVSTFDMGSVQNGLTALLDLQHTDQQFLDMFPYAGYPFNEFNDMSATYHMHTLIAVAYYFKYTGDLAYVKAKWSHFTRGMAWAIRNVDSTGMMNVMGNNNVGPNARDWGRAGMGGHNVEANAIFYYALNQGIILAKLVGDSASVSAWAPVASKVKEVTNSLLWDSNVGLYKDNENSKIYPQDGNVWAIKSGLTTSDAQNAGISAALKARWGKYGAPAPESVFNAGTPAYIAPFVGSLELEAHIISGNPQNAIDLMRLQWGFMLNDPRMTGSTFIEGYREDGDLSWPQYNSQGILSHSHGWSTGPTASLSFGVAGIQLDSDQGKTWTIRPQLGDLTEVFAGFKTNQGSFNVEIEANSNGDITTLRISTPPGTLGSLHLPNVRGQLASGWGDGKRSVRSRGAVRRSESDGPGIFLASLPGGDWHLVLDN